MEEKEKIDYEEAVKMLPEGDMIHTFVNPGIGMLVGADWDREHVLRSFKEFGVEKSGEQATLMKHGLVFWDGARHVFVETISTPMV